MIELDVNGMVRTVDPGTNNELREQIEKDLEREHGICSIIVDGREIGDSQLDDYDVSRIRRIEVTTAPLGDLARDSIGETRDWISRICNVLDSIAGDYRLGREREGASRLVDVIDALQVLVSLLQGIRLNLPLQDHERASLDEPWLQAEISLRDSIETLVADFEAGDPVRLADRTGYLIPRCLGSFRDLLGQIPT